jgi:hypothetical protein
LPLTKPLLGKLLHHPGTQTFGIALTGYCKVDELVGDQLVGKVATIGKHRALLPAHGCRGDAVDVVFDDETSLWF